MTVPDRFYVGEVLERSVLSPHVTRVVLGGSGLADFTSSGKADEAVYLLLPRQGGPRAGTDGPRAGTFEPELPIRIGDGWGYPEGVPEPEYRWYTVRRLETVPSVRLTIDVVGHDSGVATRWARSTRPGDRIGFSSPRGWHAPPPDLDWLLLVGDLTALPAIARILERLDPTVRAKALIEIPDHADRQQLRSPAPVDVAWVENARAGYTSSKVADLVRSTTLPPGSGYVWVAGEAAATRDARKYLRHELHMASDRYCVVGYWRLARELWEARYESSVTDFEAIWEEAERAGLDDETVLDVYEDALAREGL